MLIKLDKNSNVPIYMQIVDGVKTLVMTSKMHAHEQVPSVRKLARELQINPNTVQKAYALLKKEEIIYSRAGLGDYVADNVAAIKEMKKQQIIRMFEEATKEARGAGMWIDEIFTIVDEVYSR
ncbi:GntR family transcriptional regulator [Christensenellaceae bacterium OttesenSCG-928-K19]|nr:GntR family transcriptional regulator [Christensenellaceae bacterium OttesenSCG-928-K19]